MKKNKNSNDIPTNWYLKDCEEVSKYAANKWGSDLIPIEEYFYSEFELPDGERDYMFSEKPHCDCIEITLQDFKKYVLKEVVEEVISEDLGYLTTLLKTLKL